MADPVASLEKNPTLALGLLALGGAAFFIWKRRTPPPADLIDPRTDPADYGPQVLPAQGTVDGWIPADTYNALLAQYQALEAQGAQNLIATPANPAPAGSYEDSGGE